jgi:rhodanese-related sulfurtransferase
MPELERHLKAMGLGKDATIILICRSGDRSSKAQDRLQASGYTKVYGIAEGFEGDTAQDGGKKGQRVVNGWKNANLPWTYKLDKAKMYFPK